MLTIRLLGRPAIEHDGRPGRSPRGRKAWALLAYVLLSERPPSRQRLAELLFGEADDPLGALRWTLAELRRSLGRSDVLTGDPVGGLENVVVDVGVAADQLADPAPLLDAAGELLEGVYLPYSPEFESWLSVERYRVAGMVEARLRQAAVALLAAGRAGEALRYAQRAVLSNPVDEGNHELLVRSLAMTGDGVAARRQVALAEDVLRRELGVTASAALHDAATVGIESGRTPPLGGRSAALSQLEAGRAAIVAGAVDAGVQCLRRAVVEAGRTRDTALRARALVALGAALVHAVRGRDQEGALVLHEGLDHATRAGDRALAVTAQRELGFVEVQAGRRATADTWLASAQMLATDDAELAGILGVRGQNASDVGDYPEAFAHLGESIERARRCGDDRQRAWSQSILARAHLLRSEHSQAAVALADCLDVVRAQRWMVFLPWPQTLRAELDLRAGDFETAADTLERAWTLACQVGDPCWEGMAARGLGLLNAGRGDDAAATGWLGEATVRCNRMPDRYHWLHAHVLDTAIEVALDRDEPERAGPLVATLAPLAARCELRELVVRAQVHRHRLGDPTALRSARSLAADIDNPALAGLLAEQPLV
ncbi:AfsR/SARP family transcriptional regulator [Jiangella asiatica]|uniref:SARP family transcriptional regulator n=1 Tax=Jiangella asiatica TaxID=2530372 RepID=A0A4R5CXB0_9ACTN|nr:tetratricopeptide repeat protein [Jiangella asiatica]TDE02555.1 SARP family transcriptional regulator [Jiangella asiatica]